MDKKGRILFRADGNGEIGLGHIVRSGALAAMLRDEWDCLLFTRCDVQPVMEDAKNNFQQVIPLPVNEDYRTEATDFITRLTTGDIVVLDGYNFNTAYQEAIRSTGAALVCIDDIHNYFFTADMVINSAGGITPADYKALPGTQFYLGLPYTLLRKPFLDSALNRQSKPTNNNIFICLGGADPANDTLEVLKFLAPLNKFDVFTIVTGAGYRHREALEDFTRQNKINAKLLQSLAAEEMAAVMAGCAFGVCSPSTVSYEYMTVGGILFLKQIADNQQDMIRYLTREGYAFHLKDIEQVPGADQQRSLEKQALVFDGKAGKRLKDLFQRLQLSQKISVRKVTPGDMMLCYEWANDPAVRAQSFSSAAISIENHQQWFENKLNDTNAFFYILELKGEPVAQVRLQVSGNEAVISYLMDKQYRSKGLGTAILSKGIGSFVNDHNKAIAITGFVKHDNIASQKAFEKLNFKKYEAPEYAGSYKYIMHYDGNQPGQ